MKQTKVIKLKDVCELVIDCEHKTAPIQETGYPSIRTPNIGRGRLILENVNRVSEETYRKWTKRAVPQAEDLILAREAPVGNVAIIPKNLKVCLGQRTVLIRTDKKKINPHYLVYLLLGAEIQGKIKSFSNGATVHHLNMKDIRNLELPELLSLETQNKISSILSNYDDLIENNIRRIEILEQMAKLVYEEWFVKFRFPGHEKVKMVPSELGEIPEGWEVKAFSEVINVNPPRKISKGKLATKVSMADLNTWQSWINSWQKEEYRSGPKFKNGDTLFARITPSLENGKTAFVNFLDDGETAFGSTEFIVFGPKIIESGLYIFFLSRSEYVRETAITAMTGTSGRQRVPNDCFDHLLICVPPNNIVERFNEIVVLFFEMIKNYSKKSLCLKKTRDLLLPKLISGEIDVSDLDIRIKDEYQENNFNFGEPQDDKGLRFKVV